MRCTSGPLCHLGIPASVVWQKRLWTNKRFSVKVQGQALESASTLLQNMHYSVFRTETTNHVGYVNHRNEFISVSDCADHAQAVRHAITLNANQQAREQAGQQITSAGNRYMRRFVGR